jgi:type I restriction enzyme S subunit
VKDSQLGVFPEHWRVMKATWLFKNIGSGTTPDSSNPDYYADEGIPWVITGDLNDGILRESSKFVTRSALAQYGTLRVYPKGSLLIAMYGATIGKASVIDISACTNQACCVLAGSGEMIAEFAFFYVLSIRQHIISMSYGGGQPNISQDTIRNLRFPVPPLDEQRAIATFLDHKTAQIDALIDKKRRMIELLKEKRTALISHAVTKGLNPDAPMKDSGVPWLGQVPAHWEVKKLFKFLLIRGGQVDPNVLPYSEMPLIAPDHIESSTGRLFQYTSAADQGAISGKYLFYPGDVLYSKIRPHLNKVTIAQESGLCSADMYAIKTPAGWVGKYLMYLMLEDNYHHFATAVSLRAGFPKINREEMKTYIAAIPPYDEQQAIVLFLEREANRIDNIVAKTEEAIAKLQQYRTAVISAAVTGQIDVRNHGAA